jgi:hypothetical protein
VTRAELAQQLRLDSRAILMHGRLEGRPKVDHSGFMPHYATNGCPLVEYQADGRARPEPQGAEIEFLITEDDFPLPRAKAAYSQRQGNLVQLMFGREGEAASAGELRVLREAGLQLQAVQLSRAPVYLAALPILTPDRFGIMSCRLYLLGVWNDAGAPLWLNPLALDSQVLLDTNYPDSQRERSCEADAAAPAREAATAPPAEWYGSLRIAATKAIEHAGDKPTEGRIHKEVIERRLGFYEGQGIANKDARARATAEVAIARGQWQLGQMGSSAPPQAASGPAATQGRFSVEDVGRTLLGGTQAAPTPATRPAPTTTASPIEQLVETLPPPARSTARSRSSR